MIFHYILQTPLLSTVHRRNLQQYFLFTFTAKFTQSLLLFTSNLKKIKNGVDKKGKYELVYKILRF